MRLLPFREGYLNIIERTVRLHRTAITAKLAVRSIAKLAQLV
jgi:FixJ family two-component response regulator